MKRKIATALLLIFVAIISCACASTTIPQKQNSTQQDKPCEDFNGYTDYDEDCEDYEFDITYKKDKDDLSPTVYVTRYGERYHTPLCHYTQNAYMKLTVCQAIDKGYTACYFCCY